MANSTMTSSHCIDGNRQLWGTHSYAHLQ
jgi:hypothetical protein